MLHGTDVGEQCDLGEPQVPVLITPATKPFADRLFEKRFRDLGAEAFAFTLRRSHQRVFLVLWYYRYHRRIVFPPLICFDHSCASHEE